MTSSDGHRKSSSASRLLSWLRSAPARLRPHAWDIALVLCVALYALTVRLLRLERVEIGGDALNKWHFVRQWFHDFDITRVEWDHHLSRFGVNVPLGVIQLLFGRSTLVYYVASIGVFVSVAVLTYLIGRLAHGRTAGLLACLWFVSFPGWIRAGSQVSPDAFGAMYVGFAMLFLLLYERAAQRKLWWLCASSACTAFAYLAKEPFAAFVGGGMVATFLISRRYRDTAIYAAIPLGVLALETIFYRLVSPYSSRFGLVSATHGNNVIRSIFDVFKRYTTLPSEWTPLLASALVAVFVLPWLVRSRRVWPLIWLPVSFFAFYTFAIKSLEPLALWARFLPRYLDVGVPFAAVLGACLFVSVAGAVVGWVLALAARTGPGVSWVPRFRALARIGPALGCALLLLLATRAYFRNPPTSKHPFIVTKKLERQMTDAYRRGLPIVATRGWRRLALKAAYKFYIDDRLLVRNGALPDWRTVPTPDHRLVREGGLAPKRSCTVRIWRRGRFLQYQSLKPLPKRCDKSPSAAPAAAAPALSVPAPTEAHDRELDAELESADEAARQDDSESESPLDSADDRAVEAEEGGAGGT